MRAKNKFKRDRLSIGLLALVAVTPATADSTGNLQNAISRAREACAKAWAGQWDDKDSKDWHARATGDHWHVWRGREDAPEIRLDFRLDDISPSGTACEMRIISPQIGYLAPPPSDDGWLEFNGGPSEDAKQGTPKRD